MWRIKKRALPEPCSNLLPSRFLKSPTPTFADSSNSQTSARRAMLKVHGGHQNLWAVPGAHSLTRRILKPVVAGPCSTFTAIWAIPGEHLLTQRSFKLTLVEPFSKCKAFIVSERLRASTCWHNKSINKRPPSPVRNSHPWLFLRRSGRTLNQTLLYLIMPYHTLQNLLPPLSTSEQTQIWRIINQAFAAPCSKITAIMVSREAPGERGNPTKPPRLAAEGGRQRERKDSIGFVKLNFKL